MQFFSECDLFFQNRNAKIISKSTETLLKISMLKLIYIRNVVGSFYLVP